MPPGGACAAARSSCWAAFGAVWGLLFGLIMNLWFWPFTVGAGAMYWEPGTGLAETIRRYALFYAVTSLVWDLLGAAGNAVLIAFFGGAVLRILERFRLRFDFTYEPEPALAGGEA